MEISVLQKLCLHFLRYESKVVWKKCIEASFENSKIDLKRVGKNKFEGKKSWVNSNPCHDIFFPKKWRQR